MPAGVTSPAPSPQYDELAHGQSPREATPKKLLDFSFFPWLSVQPNPVAFVVSALCRHQA
jgi:hypothetical protein